MFTTSIKCLQWSVNEINVQPLLRDCVDAKEGSISLDGKPKPGSVLAEQELSLLPDCAISWRPNNSLPNGF